MPERKVIRQEIAKAPEIVHLGDMCFAKVRKKVIIGGKSIKQTWIEIRLAENSNQVKLGLGVLKTQGGWGRKGDCLMNHIVLAGGYRTLASF